MGNIVRLTVGFVAAFSTGLHAGNGEWRWALVFGCVWILALLLGPCGERLA